jgi:hypothetical protein
MVGPDPMTAHRALRSIVAISLLTAAIVVAAPAPVGGVTPTPTPGFLTLLFGRAQWVSTENCVPIPGALTLGWVASHLHRAGLPISTTVVLDRTADSKPLCWSSYAMQATWVQLRKLRKDYGTSVESGSRSYANMVRLSPTRQWRESCGTLKTFNDEGFTRAWGLFAYPNNRWTTRIQRNVVSRCFSYGRTYKGGRNRRQDLTSPWFQRTVSIGGGACWDRSRRCYDEQLVGVRSRYRPPSDLSELISIIRPNQWVVIQAYRMVTGVHHGRFFSWDCRTDKWRRHWTSTPELYCWSDYFDVVSHIPSSIVVTDPTSVAIAWGRGNP